MKSLIIRDIDGHTVWNIVPCSVANAKILCDKYLKGYYEIYKIEPLEYVTVPSLSVNKVRLMLECSSLGKKIFLNFFTNSTNDTDKIRKMLTGLQVGGCTVDTVSFLEITPITQ